MLPCRFHRGREVLGADHQVERQADGLKLPQAPGHRGQAEPLRWVRFGERLVTDADQAARRRQGGQRVGKISRGQVGPADDAVYDVGLPGVVEQVRRLAGVVDGLDEDHAVNRGPGQRRAQVRDPEAAPDRRPGGNPRLIADG